MAPLDKSLTHGSQVIMRCSLQMVYQWTEELSIRTNGANRNASLTNGNFLPMVPLVRVSWRLVSVCVYWTCVLLALAWPTTPTKTVWPSVPVPVALFQWGSYPNSRQFSNFSAFWCSRSATEKSTGRFTRSHLPYCQLYTIRYPVVVVDLRYQVSHQFWQILTGYSRGAESGGHEGFWKIHLPCPEESQCYDQELAQHAVAQSH